MTDYEVMIGGQPIHRDLVELHTHFGFDESEVQLLGRLIDPEAKGEPGFVTEPYGIRTRTSNLWPEIQPYDGVLLGLPMPVNWHWGAGEWLALSRSVLSAEGRYRVMELGAGWGPACVGGAVMARTRGINDIGITAVEADADHFGFLRQHVIDNGFDPEAQTLLEAAVGVRSGYAEFPVTEEATTTYGNRPIDREGDYLGRVIARTRRVKVWSFRKLLRAESLWDLVHVDVQGGELDICRSAKRELSRRVARICLGTHSRKLDGDIYDLFWRMGWILENEHPTRMRFSAGAKSQEALNIGDGLQVWRNVSLRPDAVV